MGSYFRSIIAELLPGWAFWRSSPHPTRPLDGQPGGSKTANSESREGAASGHQRKKAEPPVDPDSENRRL